MPAACVRSRRSARCASNFFAILLLGVIGGDLELLLGLEVDQDGRTVQLGTHVLRIEDVEQDHFVAVVAQRLDGADNAFGRLPEIGNDQHDAAALQELLEVAHGLGEIGAGAGFGLLQAGQQAMQLALAGGGADIVADLVVEGDQAGGIALVRGSPGRRATRPDSGRNPSC